MHRGAQHARTATVSLIKAAEALCAQGGCTLVHRMQWQCMLLLVDGSHSLQLVLASGEAS